MKKIKISKYLLSLISVATVSCSSISLGMNISQNTPQMNKSQESNKRKREEFPNNSIEKKNNPIKKRRKVDESTDTDSETTGIIDEIWKVIRTQNIKNKSFNTIKETLIKIIKDASTNINLIDINKCFFDGSTVLNWACYENDLDIVKTLFEYADFKKLEIENFVNKADSTGKTPLYKACENNNEELVTLLLNKGAQKSLDEYDFEGRTAFYMACKNNNPNIIELLLKYARDKFNKNESDLISFVNKPNYLGWTPLYLACWNRYTSLIELLLSNSANINLPCEKGKTPLNFACENNNKDIVELLLEKGADVNIANKFGETPLYWACLKNNKEIVELLLNKSAKVDKKSLNIAEDKSEILELLNKNNS